MLKKKNCALLGLGFLLGGTYEILKEKKRNEEIRNLKRRIIDSEDVIMNLLCIKENTMTEMKKNKKN